MEGARVDKVELRRPDLRAPFPQRFTARLEGQTIRSLSRRGKYLLAELSSGDVLLMHLGMSGSFRVARASVAESTGSEPGAASLSHDHVVFHMSSGATVTFNDPRRFGVMALISREELATHRALGALGPEPLAREFDGAVLARACRGRKTSLKAALSDQRVIAGLGNIYVCEALHRARLSPRRRASSIATRSGAPREAAHRLVAAITKVLNDAITRSVAMEQGQPGARDVTAYFPDRFRVYDREGARCRTRWCIGRVRRIVQAGRSTFFCPVCQR
jgi:formamidopyrimidine-DNA glycosylase